MKYRFGNNRFTAKGSVRVKNLSSGNPALHENYFYFIFA